MRPFPVSWLLAVLVSAAPAHAARIGDSAPAFDVKGMPSSYLVDRNGIVVAVEEGFRDEHVAALEARIRALLAAR